MALTVGSRLGHYDMTALIAEGGMGQVYQASDTKLNRYEAQPADGAEPSPGDVETRPLESRRFLLVWSYDASPSRQSQ